MKYLVADPEKCVGYMRCELACSYAHYGVFSPAKAGIQILKIEESSTNIPAICQPCAYPVCMEVCSSEVSYAIEKLKVSNTVHLAQLKYQWT